MVVFVFSMIILIDSIAMREPLIKIKYIEKIKFIFINYTWEEYYYIEILSKYLYDLRINTKFIEKS